MTKSEYLKTWRKKNKESLSSFNKKRRNDEKYKEKQREWYKKWLTDNPNKRKEYAEKYKQLRRKNKPIGTISEKKKRPYTHEGYLKQKASILNCLHKRRTVLKQTDITSAWLKLLWEDTSHCILCGKKMNDDSKYPDGKQLDHIIPINIGGLHMMDNVRYVCCICNNTRPKDGRDLING